MADRPGHTRRPIIIVGAGQAGLQIAESLRQEGYEGGLLLLGEESHPPYNRPPLSKKWLADRAPASGLAMRGAEALARKRIELRTATRVRSVDVARQTLTLESGETLEWEGLAFATGARLRPLPVPGAGLGGVYGLRTIDDAIAIGAAIDRCVERAEPVVVIGGGFIGLEVAATARKRGAEVVVFEAEPRLMSRVVAPIVSDAFARVHEAHGVRVICDAQVTALRGETGVVSSVLLADGAEQRAGCVVVGIGVIPADEIAAAAGIACRSGILVDACSRTSHPRVVAAGDCTARQLESVQGAVEQGKAAAAALMGKEKPFHATPWFWSDQYDIKLQMAGLSTGYDQVVTRGDLEKPAFSAYYFKAGRLIAVDSLSRVSDHLKARKLLDAGISPSAEQVADESFDLASLRHATPAAPGDAGGYNPRLDTLAAG
jgi:3-phenylpropionate/trans-cinnamate dioxygenase ferredoxin reductase subunit